MGYQSQREEAIAFANFAKGKGFKVYLSDEGRGTYGFITDGAMSRVLSFSFSGIGSSLSGNYGPPSTESGTGWAMERDVSSLQTAADIHAALYAHPPVWAGNGWKYLSTVEQYLAMYGSSSKFREV